MVSATDFLSGKAASQSKKSASDFLGVGRSRASEATPLDAAAFGVGQAMTLGFSDELEAGLRTGFGLYGDYDKTLSDVRATMADLQEQYPWLTFGSELAGGVVGGAGLVKSGATLAGRAGPKLLPNVAAGAAEGGIAGGAYGFGAGEGLEGRVANIGPGAAMGATVGGALSGIGVGLNKLRGTAGREAAIETVRQGEEFRVPVSRGQATGDVAQQAFEQEAAHGARGHMAGERARTFADRQRGAVTEAGERMATEFGGGRRIVESAQEAADVVSGAVRERAGALEKAGHKLYTAAEAGDATIAREALPDLGRRVTAALEDEIVPDNFGTLKGAVQKIEDLASLKSAPEGAVGVNWKEIERVRRSFSNAKGSTPDEGRLLGKLRKSYDDWFSDAVDSALFSGDAKTIDDLKKARSTWTQYRAIVDKKSKDPATRILTRIVDDDLDANSAANALFGISKIGAKRESVKLAGRLRREFGMDSEAMNAVRQAAVVKLMQRTKGTGQKGYVALANEIDEFLNKSGRDWARIVFKPEQVTQMRKFSQFVRRLAPDERATNPSKSAYAGRRLASGAFQALMTGLGFATAGPAGGAAGAGVGAAAGARNALRAGRAFGSPVPAAPITGPGGLPAAAIGEEGRRQLLGPR